MGFIRAFDQVGNSRDYFDSELIATFGTLAFTVTSQDEGAPSAPTGVTVVGGDRTATISWLRPAFDGDSPIVGYTVTATPGGQSCSTNGPDELTCTMTGLTNAVNYTFTVVARNAAGSSAPAAPPGNPAFTPGLPSPVIVQPPAPDPFDGTRVTLTWLAAVSPLDLPIIGYVATASPGGNSCSTTGALTCTITGLTVGVNYSFTVVAVNGAGTGPPTIVDNSSSALIYQRITVVRPVGQLILTQRCGVNGALPALAADAGFPGFQSALPAVAASADQVGTTPDITPNGVFPTGAGSLADAVTPDPQFNNYPFPSPATYPTECGVNLGTATIVSSGPLAGQYYQADGFINEVTVSDLRDTDLGWEVRGQMSDFVGTVSSTNTIDGNYLAWNPVIQNTTPTTATGYTQTVAAGPSVLPGTGVVSGSGLGSGRRLAIATENLGLGVAQMDARLRLLIPIASNNDTYTGILNFTVLDNDNDNGPL